MTIQWTNEMIDTLVKHRHAGLPLDDIANRIGVYTRGVHQKAKELGINARMNQGHWSGQKCRSSNGISLNPRVKR